MGPYPYMKIIFEKADKQTKVHLKMTCRCLWNHHVRRKYLNNFVEEQNGFLPALYCYADGCPNREAFENCFLPKLLTTNSGEICGPSSPRSRSGWPILNDEKSWGQQPPKKVKEWKGCPECWEKFIQKRPEYDISQIYNCDDSDLLQLFKRII